MKLRTRCLAPLHYCVRLFTVALTHWILFSSVSRADAFTNGSFEVPVLLLDATLELPAGSTNLPGWTIGGAGGPVTLVNNIDRLDGANYLNFNSGDRSPGTWIAQTFDTAVGGDYKVTFYVGRTGGGGGSISLTASLRSQSLDLLAQTNAVPPGHGYGNVQELLFTATSTTTTLEFLDTSIATTSVDVLLDSVSLTAIPEPSALSLLAVAGLLVARLRSQQSC